MFTNTYKKDNKSSQEQCTYSYSYVLQEGQLSVLSSAALIYDNQEND